jgi:DNA repair exonuclease SbcCD nuclease subunit
LKDSIPSKQTKSVGALRIASVSTEILSNLRVAFPDNEETAALDLIIIAGDLFHTLLFLNNEDVAEIDMWFADLLRICKKYSIKLRFLEGTPSHDRKQGHRFPAINEFAGIGADFKYVKDISIEYIEDYGISVLYVPDEANPTPEKTLSQVRELMQSRGLDQVDYAVMHGQFDYQLPPHVKAHKHDSRTYLALVKYLIFIGHVHIASRFENILAQGSFDRIAHGEESAKGHFRVTVYDSGEKEITFVENKGAKKYVTLKCSTSTVEETLLEVDQLVGTLPPYSHVRLEVFADHPILANMDTLIRRYPFVTWTKKIAETGEEEDIIEETLDGEDEYIPITITKENIVEMLMTRLGHMDNISADVLNAARNQLEEIVR